MVTTAAAPPPPVSLAPAPPRAVPPPRVRVPRGYAAAAWAAVGVGAALRAWGVPRFPLEQDELYTVMESRDLWNVALEPGIEARPLYYLLQHGLLEALPATPAALRLLPWLFGVLGVWAVWRLGLRVAGPAAGAVAAVLLALSPWHLHASGMARYWSLLFLLSALFFAALWTAYASDRPRDHLRALLPLLAGTATHPTFAFAAAGAALGVTLVRADGRAGWRWPSRAAWRWLWGPYAAFLAAAAAALALAGRDEAVRNWGGRGMQATLRLLPAMAEWTTPVVCAAAVLGMAAAWRGRDAGRRRWAAMAACGSAGTAILLVAASTRTNVYADYAIGMLPLLFVSAGALVQAGVERMRGGARPAAAAAAAVMAAAMLPATASHLSDGTRFDYRPALARAAAEAPDVTVAAWPLAVAHHYGPGLRIVGLRTGEGALEQMLADEGDLWVVASVRRFGMVGDAGAAMRWLDRRCTLAHAHERPRWDFRRYRVELYRCRADGGIGG